MESGLQFYTRRAAEERKATNPALSEEARRMHERLAEEYELKAGALKAQAAAD